MSNFGVAYALMLRPVSPKLFIFSDIEFGFISLYFYFTYVECMNGSCIFRQVGSNLTRNLTSKYNHTGREGKVSLGSMHSGADPGLGVRGSDIGEGSGERLGPQSGPGRGPPLYM